MLFKSPDLWIFVVLTVVLSARLPAFGESATNLTLQAQAEAVFEQARENYQTNTNSAEAACQYARANSELAEFATNDTQRAQIARQGIAVCRELLAREPNSAPAHYYLGINLGKLAQAEAPSLTAYRLVYEVESEFKIAANLDVNYDYAGPARTLGLLYLQAPGWPLSIGSRSKARQWLERAAELAPNYPPNQLNLAEAQLKWRQRNELAATLKKMDAIWPVAKTNFVGLAWDAVWPAWNARRTAIKYDYQRVYGEK